MCNLWTRSYIHRSTFDRANGKARSARIQVSLGEAMRELRILGVRCSGRLKHVKPAKVGDRKDRLFILRGGCRPHKTHRRQHREIPLCASHGTIPSRANGVPVSLVVGHRCHGLTCQTTKRFTQSRESRGSNAPHSDRLPFVRQAIQTPSILKSSRLVTETFQT